MRYLAAYALAFLSGKENPSAADVKKILEASGADVDDAKISAIVDKLTGQDIASVVTTKL
jgi:large subunit ribosomal protein LP2